MLKRIVLVVSLLVLWPALLPADGFGPDFLVKLDLERSANFELAQAMDLKAVFRWGNEFYVVVDGETLSRLNNAELPCVLIETDPFKSGHYYLESADAGRLGLSKMGARQLDRIAGADLWKTDQPLARNAFVGIDCPYKISGAEIPLTYMMPLVASGQVNLTDPMLDSISGVISRYSISEMGVRFDGFQTRYVLTDSNDAARHLIEQKFLSYGYTDVRSDTFYIQGGRCHNVICTKTGVTNPEKVVIIGAHFDSWNSDSNPRVFAPGADDNASGTIGVLEIARALADIPTRETIIFIAFDAEEVGLLGSVSYAEQALASGMDIDLMLNMDMIAYESNSIDEVSITTASTSVAFAELMAQIATEFTVLTPFVFTDWGGGSDHASFALRGYEFVYVKEYERNPHWHSDEDRFWALDIWHWTNIARMVGLTAYAVSEAPSPVSSLQLQDPGDGTSLRLANGGVSTRMCAISPMKISSGSRWSRQRHQIGNTIRPS